MAAPHPDDEILGCGMALRRLAADGRNITIAACTDGEASHARSTAIRPEELVRRRVDERASAFAILGIAPRVVRLGLPDGDLASRAADLADALATLCSPATTLVVPWEHDGHPDHRAVALAGRLAAGRSGAALWRTPIWGKVRRARAFAGCVHRLELGAADRALKRAAAATFVTQLVPVGPGPDDGPVVHPAELDRMLDGVEVVLR